MFKINKISTKIKLIGALFMFLMVSVIGVTIYLNEQNTHDAIVINMAGKQRMLTQKISKNIFYIQHNRTESLDELNAASLEFSKILNTLKNGDSVIGIKTTSKEDILKQLDRVSSGWSRFYALVEEFKSFYKTDKQKTDEISEKIHRLNTIFLEEIDTLVALYTIHSESKTAYMKKFQYASAFILLLLLVYALLKLKSIEANVDAFMNYSKMLAQNDTLELTPLELNIESEDEIVEVSDTLNQFINKVNLAVECSNEALKQSQDASSKLEELAEEFDSILGELNDKSKSQKHLNNSEDIVIESTENLIISTKKLNNLQKELQELIASCKQLN